MASSIPLPLNPNSPPIPPHSSTPTSSTSSSSIRCLAVTLGVGIGVGLAVAPQLAEQRSLVANSLRDVCTQKRTTPSYFWAPLACLSLATDIADMEKIKTIVEPNTGVSFPSVLDGTKQLAGVGVRKTSIIGRKSIQIYAFGLYVDENSLKENFVDKYGKMSVTELKDSKEFYEDVIGNDLSLTVKLEIVYGKLSIGSVRRAFKVLLGSQLRRFNGSQNNELLQRFTSQLKDEYKLSRGTKLQFTRLPGQVLQTKIDEKEVGRIQSPLLCRSLFDLYIGEYPFDKKAKENIGVSLASLLTQTFFGDLKRNLGIKRRFCGGLLCLTKMFQKMTIVRRKLNWSN